MGWLHVNGCIRIDSLRWVTPDPTLNLIQELLGDIIKYDHVGLFGTKHGERPDSPIPCGTEGSLEYEIIVNPDPNTVVAYTIPIWGDLRHYTNIAEVEDWFYNIVRHEDLIMRQAVLQIDDNNGNVKVLYHNATSEEGES